MPLQIHGLGPFEQWPLQNDFLRTLYDRLARGVVPHTMLFIGDVEDTAKITSYVAQLLLCEGEAAPCGRCESCRLFAAGTHPDYTVVGDADAASIKTLQIEQLQKVLMLRSHGGGRLVYVLRGIDNATMVAANRLLKTLEEPSPAVVALLTATSLGRVLPTIVSRSFLFRLSDNADAIDWDDPYTIPASVGTEQVNGGFATLLRPMIQWSRDLFHGHEPGLLLAASFMKSTAGMDLDFALHTLSLWFRDLLHYSLGDLSHIRFHEFERELIDLSNKRSPQQLSEMIQIVLDTRTRLRAHVVPALNIERMSIRLQEVN